MKKVFLSVILVFTIMASLILFIPITTNASTGGTDDAGLQWTLDDDGVLTITGKGQLKGSKPWDEYSSDIEKIVIGEGITSVSRTFSEFANLKSVTLPESVTSIGSYAFNECYNLETINIPNGVTQINPYTFYRCYKLSKISIPDKVKTIGWGAFHNCSSLTSVIIPDSVTSIAEHSFSKCYKLTDLTIGKNVKNIDRSAFFYCSSLTSVKIPDSVTTIGDSAFHLCESLENITIGTNVKTIEIAAFLECPKQKNVYISDLDKWYDITFESYSSNPLWQGGNLFLNDVKITNLVIPNDIDSINEYAFYNCSGITSVTIPNNITSIGKSAFYSMDNLDKVYISDMYQWCNIDFENENSNPLSNIAKLYLNGERITELIIPDSIEAIKNYAFYQCCEFTSVSIPDSVTSIGNYAFYRSEFENITIGKNVVSIGDYAFYMSSIIDITIPVSVTSIGNYAFYYCSSLNNVYYGGFKSQWDTISIGSANYPLTNATIHYLVYVSGITLDKTSVTIFTNNTETLIPTIFPSNATNKNIEWISSNEEVATVINGVVTAIGKGEAIITAKTIDGGYESSCLVTVQKVFGNGIVENGIEWVLYDNGLLSITGKGSMPNYSTTSDIPWYSNRAKVNEIAISENITHIGDKTFYGCINAQKATIPNTVTTIGNNAFKNYDELTIYGEMGTYAQIYAEKNEIPFVNTRIWDVNVDFVDSSSKWYFDVIVEDFSGKAIVYVATYDSDDRMLDIDSENFVVNDITSLSLSKQADASYAKVFVWTSYLMPITELKKIDL